MFITLEGVEGSGKSSVIAFLARKLEEAGQPYLLTREPGGSPLGEKIRPLLLEVGQDLAPLTELFMFQADRAQHVAQIIRPALQNGVWVICDRYSDSTVAYQGYGRGMDPDVLHDMCDAATGGLWPDLTLLLDISPELGLERANRRNEEKGLTRLEGRFEAEKMAFHQLVRQGYLDRATRFPERFATLDSALPLEELQEKAWNILREKGAARA